MCTTRSLLDNAHVGATKPHKPGFTTIHSITGRQIESAHHCCIVDRLQHLTVHRKIGTCCRQIRCREFVASYRARATLSFPASSTAKAWRSCTRYLRVLLWNVVRDRCAVATTALSTLSVSDQQESELIIETARCEEAKLADGDSQWAAKSRYRLVLRHRFKKAL